MLEDPVKTSWHLKYVYIQYLLCVRAIQSTAASLVALSVFEVKSMLALPIEEGGDSDRVDTLYWYEYTVYNIYMYTYDNQIKINLNVNKCQQMSTIS